MSSEGHPSSHAQAKEIHGYRYVEKHVQVVNKEGIEGRHDTHWLALPPEPKDHDVPGDINHRNSKLQLQGDSLGGGGVYES